MQTKRSQHRPGESKIFYVKCAHEVNGGTAVHRHRVKLTLKGRLTLLDHAHGEPEQVLCMHKLAGAAPRGCYAVLHRLQTSGARTIALYQRGMPRETQRFLTACVEAANGVHTVRTALRAQRPCSGVLEHQLGRPVWAVSQDSSVVQTLLVKGEPAMFGLWTGRRPYVARSGGFVKVNSPSGAILWDAAFPGIELLAAQGTEKGTPGMLALVRLTEQVLRGWRGVLKAQG